MLQCELTSLTIPTYHRGGDDGFAPLSFSGRMCRGRTPPFPYHAQDDIDLATMRFEPECRHRAYRLTNGLLEALILPDMNGRLYSLRDMRSGRELFYRNHVVKPALVALRGAWLSGGVEFNFPTQGHTVSTVSPVLHRGECHAGEAAVLLSDLDRSTRQRWQARLSLKPGRAALDIDLAFTNPNAWRERLYYWENAAVPAAEDLRFVCRCDWTVGAKSLPFPLRDGVDRSMHVSNPTPLDHFGYRSEADYFGAYYRDRRVGTYHVAQRFLEPGQKYFTWGTREDSLIWQKYLTDRDGQYVEIQAGVLESQWFSGWLQPQETLKTHGCWFGTEGMDEVAWADEHVAVSVREADGLARLQIYSIDVSGDCVVVIGREGAGGERAVRLDPGRVSDGGTARAGAFRFELRRRTGALLMRENWHGGDWGMRDPARDRTPPQQWAMEGQDKTVRHKAETAEKNHSWEAMAAALRETGNACLEAMLALKCHDAEGAYTKAAEALAGDPEDLFAHSIAAAAAYRRLRLDGGSKWFQAVWDHGLVIRRDTRYANLALWLMAKASLLMDRVLEARALLALLVEAAPECVEGRALLAALLRRCGEGEQAAVQRRLLYGSLWGEWFGYFESVLAADGEHAPRPCQAGERFQASAFAAHRAESPIEHLLLYWECGLLDDVKRLLADPWLRAGGVEASPVYALLCAAVGAGEEAGQAAKGAPPAVLSRWEDEALLRAALGGKRAGAAGLSFQLGCICAETRRYEEAKACFEKAYGAADPELKGIVGKALADWWDCVGKSPSEVLAYMREVNALMPNNGRILCLLDDGLHEQQDITEREALWRSADASLRKRGDVVFRLARLALANGRAGEAVSLMAGQSFSVQEGATMVRRLYVDASLVDAMQRLRQGDLCGARACCRAVLEYPENLGAASYLGEHSRLARYLLGVADEKAGNRDGALSWWKDVLSRGGEAATYTVGGEASASLVRLDERVALALADRRVNGTAKPNIALVSRAVPATAGESERMLADVIVAGSWADAAEFGAEALKRYPCADLLRILAELTTAA